MLLCGILQQNLSSYEYIIYPQNIRGCLGLPLEGSDMGIFKIFPKIHMNELSNVVLL